MPANAVGITPTKGWNRMPDDNDLPASTTSQATDISAEAPTITTISGETKTLKPGDPGYECGGACCRAAAQLRAAYEAEQAAAAKEGGSVDASKIEGFRVASGESNELEGKSHVMSITADGEIIHVMDGVPTGLAIGAVVAIVLASHVFVKFRQKVIDAPYWRFDLLGFSWVKSLVKRSWFPMAIQSASLAAFLLICTAGLFGSQRTNIAPVLTWTWWWVLLIFLIVGFGTAFCAICPWEAISSFVGSLSLRSRAKRLGFERKWPRVLRNVYPALGLFVLLTWFELGHDVTGSPMMTAVMALMMVALAVGTNLLFERRAFCRHLCLVGRISGLYALFSPVEVRPIAEEVCRSCESKACYKGDGKGATGCPTNLFPGALKENSYCTSCTECVRACPHDNMAVNVRPFATDLLRKTKFRWDEAVLAITLLALTTFHGLTMIPQWGRWNDLIRVETGLGPKVVFTILMLAMTAVPILLFWATAATAHGLTREALVPTGKIFRAFAYSVIPVALFYHLAHNGMHFFMEAQNLLPVLSDPFGRGWDLFGTARKVYEPLLSMRAVWWLQIVLIVIGHVYGVVVAERIVRRLFAFRENRFARRALLPLIATMILFSCFSVWLIAQPMEMRTGM